jgi:hypothetical protein
MYMPRENMIENYMNEDLGSPIAYGRTAEIFAWRNEKVLKLFYDWFSLADIEAELRIAQTIRTNGLPVPLVGGIVRVNGRHGLTYQRMEGFSMFDMMLRRPWNILFYARRVAELHARLHASTIQGNIPPLHQKLTNKIDRAGTLLPIFDPRHWTPSKECRKEIACVMATSTPAIF